MGRLILQLMITVDGKVSGPKGELDWIANDQGIFQDHLARLEQASVVVLGGASYPGMRDAWAMIAEDENADEASKAIGRAMNKTPMVIYSHEDKPAKGDDKIRVIKDDQALVEDVQRLKKETDGTLVSYGGVRFARSLVRLDLVDEIHLDVCPVILGEGQLLFTELTHGTKLRLLKSTTHDSGATEMHYEVVKD
ncbi:MAG TPA: dihydrofolate reductase family protein [Candidatus Saccharimonadales bacterium]